MPNLPFLSILLWFHLNAHVLFVLINFIFFHISINGIKHFSKCSVTYSSIYVPEFHPGVINEQTQKYCQSWFICWFVDIQGRRHCLAWFKSRQQLMVYIGW
jgi:hypothetical protein